VKKVFLHPVSIRIWHWINAGLIAFLIITGLQLRFAWVSLFQYGNAVYLHKIAGFFLAGSFLYWVAYYLITGNFKQHYVFHTRDFKGMMRQASYYAFSMFKHASNPFTPSTHERFNPLQKIAYLSVMLILTPIILFTGILFSDIVYFFNIIKYIGGVRILDALHVATGYAFLLYLIVHLYMSTLGYRIVSHIKAMIIGYGEEYDE
jgi:thiosulfate reductase cytochrome b subunit